MDGVAAGDAHSVSAVAVIDLGDSGGGRGSGGHGDPHGLLSSHSVVVIGGEEHLALLRSDGHSHDEEEEDDEDEEDDGEEGGGCGCGESCGHADAPPHMIRIHGDHSHSHSPTPSSNASTHDRDHGSSHANKRKRVVLSIHDKQQVLQRLDMGEQPVVISRDFGISRQQVSDIKKNKDRILAFCIDAKHLSSLRRKTLKATTEYHPGVEQELYRWLIRQRKLGRGVSPEALAHKTTDLFMQYAADDATNVSFRSINLWLRHFKRAHNIKAMDDDELARLPTKFTPAMDMAGASQGVGNTDGSSATSNGGSGEISGGIDRESSTPSMLHDHDHAATHTTQSSLPPPAAADDVSSYMTNMELAHATPPLPPHPSSFILQNHAPTIDMNGTNPYQMLMLSSAPLPTTTTTASTNPFAMAMASSASAGLVDATPLHSCVYLAQKMNADVSRFETAMAVKLDSLDARVEKLCYSVLSTTTSTPTTTAAAASASASSHVHTTSSRFA